MVYHLLPVGFKRVLVGFLRIPRGRQWDSLKFSYEDNSCIWLQRNTIPSIQDRDYDESQSP